LIIASSNTVGSEKNQIRETIVRREEEERNEMNVC